MKKLGLALIAIIITLAVCQSCKKSTVHIVDFSAYTATNNKCEIIGPVDTNQWINNVLTRPTDTLQLVFADNVIITDSIAGPITITPPCPNSSDGFFIWNVNPTRQCKLKLVCVNTNYDILYYNSYALNGGPVTLGFDFRALTAFKSNSSYRMYYAFYNSRDSLYFSGYGDIKIKK